MCMWELRAASSHTHEGVLAALRVMMGLFSCTVPSVSAARCVFAAARMHLRLLHVVGPQ